MIKYYTSNLLKAYQDGVVNKAYINGDVVYQRVAVPPTPTEFKWIATYTTGVTSAECDSSSAITQNEITKANLISVEIGQCVTEIGQGALFNCASITSLTIGSGIEIIGDNAFQFSPNYQSITILATTPPTLAGNSSFSDTNDCPIYVPPESVEVYKNASGYWRSYYYRIQPIP